MLTRSSQIGEFYIMMPPQVKPTGTGTGLNLHTADMLIYDEESDKHVRITWREALKATLANARNAAGDRVLGDQTGVSKGHSGTIALSTWAERAEAIAKYSSGTDEDGNPVDVADDAWDNLDRSIRIVVARPFIEHLMVRCSPIGHARARLTLSLSPLLCAAQRHPRGRGARDGRHAFRPCGHAAFS